MRNTRAEGHLTTAPIRSLICFARKAVEGVYIQRTGVLAYQHKPKGDTALLQLKTQLEVFSREARELEHYIGIDIF
jgi:hypothetical protein